MMQQILMETVDAGGTGMDEGESCLSLAELSVFLSDQLSSLARAQVPPGNVDFSVPKWETSMVNWDKLVALLSSWGTDH